MQGGNGDETLKGQEKAYSSLSFVQGVDVPVEEVQGSFIAAGQSQLVEQFTCEAFFFNLLRNVPLHEIVRGVVLQTQALIHDIVDAGRYAGFVF